MKFTARFYSTNSSLGNYKNAPSGKTYTSDMSVEGDERVYRFNVAKSGTMKIRLAADYYSSYSDDILATLYRDSDDNDVEISNMNVISGSYYENNDTYASIGYKTTDELSYKVTKGTYYLRLFWSNTGTLSMTATYPEGSSNDGKISCLSLNLKKDGTLQLGAVMAVDGNVTWTSSKTSVATVSSTGKVTAKGTGTAVITAKSGKNSVKIQIRVS
ncbi:glycerophosphoryl diester phosphodiesterase [Eubacterium sp. CAG:115]|nr:glycerophosphoryl diester phosphodiesterase [Eubacterium sp. CAG:115]